jgi:hypothetical protein
MTSRTTTPEDIAKIKSKWVGLTDEERLRCFDDIDWNKVDWCPDHEQYAKAIEAKLKEKNT